MDSYDTGDRSLPSRSEGAAMDTSDTGTPTSSRGRGRRGAATPAASEASGIVVLGPRDSLVGTLSVHGDVRIEGTLDGEATATGELTIDSTGTARAQLAARDIFITGSVDGNANASDLLTLGETATFAGELRAARLRVDEGAMINAIVTMGATGDAPPARRMDEHDDETSVDVTGSPVGEGDHGAYAEESAGSESDAYSDERTAETSNVSSGSDSVEG
jgi:cytoskeletal protein CcmA (bactofilin family)